MIERLFHRIPRARPLRELGSVLVATAALCLVGCTDHRAAIHAAASNRARRAAPAGHWSKVAPMHVARVHATATVLDDGRVLVVGGVGANGFDNTLASVEIYDPRHDTWTPAAPLPSARTSSAAVRLRDGSVLVAGGNPSVMGSESPIPAERYIPAEDTWVPAGRTAGSGEYSALLLRDGRVILMGGFKIITGTSSASPVESLYAPRDNSWTTIKIPERILDPLTAQSPILHSVVLGDGRVLAIGAGGPTAISDPQLASWKKGQSWEGEDAADSSPVGAALVSGGRVLVVACSSSPGVATAVLYDPAAGTWKRVAGPRAPCTGSSLIRMEDGRAMLLGASITQSRRHGPCRSAGQPEVYDASRNTWTVVPMPGPEPLSPTAVAIKGGVLAIGGGRCRGNRWGVDVLADVERFSAGP